MEAVDITAEENSEDSLTSKTTQPWSPNRMDSSSSDQMYIVNREPAEPVPIGTKFQAVVPILGQQSSVFTGFEKWDPSCIDEERLKIYLEIVK